MADRRRSCGGPVRNDGWLYVDDIDISIYCADCVFVYRWPIVLGSKKQAFFEKEIMIEVWC